MLLLGYKLLLEGYGPRASIHTTPALALETLCLFQPV